MIKLKSADLMSIFCNGGPEKTLKVEYDRSPRYITRKQLYNIPHLHYHVRFRRQGVLRFPFGENEALCFTILYVNETARSRIFWQNYKIFVTKQHWKQKSCILLSKFHLFSQVIWKAIAPNNNTAIHSAMHFIFFFLFSSIILF